MSRDLKAGKPKNSIATLGEVLRDDPEENSDDYEDPEILVTRAEARAMEKLKMTKKSSTVICSKRNYAEALHKQADQLHHRGDYETALVLYHRAARVYPRELSHDVAARRTAAAISSATNPSRALRNVLPGAKNSSQLAANFCPETAALRAKEIVKESPDPVSTINQLLKYFESRKDFWRDSLTLQDQEITPLLSRSKIMSRQLSALASVTLEDLQTTFASGDFKKSLKIGDELIIISEALPNSYRYQVAARHYLAMTQIALRRHDRAVDHVSRMVRLARESGDIVLRSRSMMTLGKVHLSFRHFDAAARAWESLVVDVEEAVPKAWLLHEIGRCYFEMKRYGKALETAGRCIEYADEGNSRKWLMHGKLLSGQALVELGRLGEAVGAFKVASVAAKDEKDYETHDYISNLIDRVTTALRVALCTDEPSQLNVEAVNGKTWKAKSDEILRCNDQTYWISESNEKAGKTFACKDSKQKLKINVSRSFGRIKPSQAAKTKMKKTKTRNQRVARSRILDPKIAPDNIGSSELPSKMTPKLFSDDPDFSNNLRNFVESGDDELTSRMRVIREKTQEHGISPGELGRSDGIKMLADEEANLSSHTGFIGDPDEEIADDKDLPSRSWVSRKVTQDYENLTKLLGTKSVVAEEADSVSVDDDDDDDDEDDERSNDTGKTYVLNESKNLTKDQSSSNIEAANMENQFSDKSEIIHELDNSNYAEYLRGASTNDLAIFLVRARLRDDGIDEGEEDAEPDEGAVFSSTHRTYVLRKPGLRDDGIDEVEEDAEREEAGAFSSTHRTVFSSCESKLSFAPTGETRASHETKTMSLRELASCYVDYEKTMRNPERHNDPSAVGTSLAYSRRHADGKIIGDAVRKTGDERCEIDSEEMLPNTESIHAPCGQRSLYRHSLPSSPRKESPCEVVAITKKR